MRKRTCSVVFAACLVAWAVPSAAQAPATNSGQASGPTVNMWYLGANTGVAIVENAGATVGGEVGFRAWKNLDLLVEGSWMQDLVTRLTLENAQKVADFGSDRLEWWFESTLESTRRKIDPQSQ